MVMRPRERRLHHEHEQMRQLERSSSMVSFSSAGIPPTQYAVTLSCRGLRRFGDTVAESNIHQFDVTLSESFPLVPPVVVWLTPVFHPNLKPPYVCTGDIWYPAMSIAEFVVALCELVQYKSFNIYDPLDEEATTWLVDLLQSEAAVVPIDPRPVVDLDFEIGIRPATQDGSADGEH